MKKNLVKIVCALILFLPIFNIRASVEIEAFCFIDNFTQLGQGPVGVWVYTVSNADPEYSNGVLYIEEKEKGMYTVSVQLKNGTLTGQDVEVDGNTIKFGMNIEGVERVLVELKVDGNLIKGEVYTSQGPLKIEGNRKLPPK
ncbi:hypothetical protein [Maribacter thermophilus]|uniref:hypothetical protein n=1 Tax=Maribacter thermophilus TaxID=1197874 RepID=UPI0006414302|nr:hypothetical protein [Maribacter thermophilus]